VKFSILVFEEYMAGHGSLRSNYYIITWIKGVFMKEFRCKFCHRLLAKVEDGSKVEIKCPKCKTLNLYQEETVIVYDIPENNVTKKFIDRGFVKYDIVSN